MTATTLLSHDTTLIVMPWPDREADQRGHDARGRYAELFVLPVLGPSATWLLRRLVDGLESYPDGYELDLAETAVALGLNYTPDRVGPFARALQRCVMFGYAQTVPYGLAVRSRLGNLSPRQLERLPAHLRMLHHEYALPVAPKGDGITPRRSS
jgi:hypothetical protein